MRVLFVAKGVFNEKGGAAIAALKSVNELCKLVDVRILTDFIPQGTQPMVKSYAYLLEPAPAASPLNYLRHNRRGSAILADLAHKWQPDIIHIHSYAGFAIRPPIGFKSIVTIHDAPLTYRRDHISPKIVGLGSILLGVLERWNRRYLFRTPSYFHALSTFVKRDILRAGIRPSRIFVLPNGVDSTPKSVTGIARTVFLKRLGLSPNSKIAIAIGAVGFRKGIHTLAEAASIVARENSLLHIFVIGKIQSLWERMYYQTIAKKLKQSDTKNFHFTGFVSEELLELFLSYADVYVNASYSEACNLGLLDAIIRSIPIVCTDVGAIQELCGGTCSYFDFEDSNMLAQHLLNVIKKPRPPSKEQIQSWESIMTDMVAIYEQILSR